MVYFHRLLASLFGIINLLAIIPISLVSYVMGVGFCYKVLGIDLSVSLVLGFIFMIVAVGLINGLAAVFLSILDQLNVMRHDREAILGALHHIRQNTYPQKPLHGYHFGDKGSDHRDMTKPSSEPIPTTQSVRVSQQTSQNQPKTKPINKARQRKAQSKGKANKAATKTKTTKGTVTKAATTRTKTKA